MNNSTSISTGKVNTSSNNKGMDKGKPIAGHKQVCKDIAPEGWAYTGYDDGFYLYQKGNYKEGFKEIKVLEIDLDKKNLVFMAKHNLTR